MRSKSMAFVLRPRKRQKMMKILLRLKVPGRFKTLKLHPTEKLVVENLRATLSSHPMKLDSYLKIIFSFSSHSMLPSMSEPLKPRFPSGRKILTQLMMLLTAG
jgi:hypothetical protein